MITAGNARADETRLIEPLRPFVRELEASLDSLSDKRRVMLGEVADYVAERIKSERDAQLIFICTHNSRRSHFSQVWSTIASECYQVPRVRTFSGGTEATACNIRTIRALRRVGLSAVASTRMDNPIYLIQYSDAQPPLRAYSKVYSADGNPTEGFAAMMCCSDVDELCPLVRGADGRFPLHYEDPKVGDDTPRESSGYDERNVQIAREMFHVMAQVAERLELAERDAED